MKDKGVVFGDGEGLSVFRHLPPGEGEEGAGGRGPGLARRPAVAPHANVGTQWSLCGAPSLLGTVAEADQHQRGSGLQATAETVTSTIAGENTSPPVRVLDVGEGTR